MNGMPTPSEKKNRITAPCQADPRVPDVEQQGGDQGAAEAGGTAHREGEAEERRVQQTGPARAAACRRRLRTSGRRHTIGARARTAIQKASTTITTPERRWLSGREMSPQLLCRVSPA